MYSWQTKFLQKAAAQFSLENSVYSQNYRRLILKRRLAEFIISTLLIMVGQNFVINNDFFTTLWPASGVGLSALFLRGNTILLGIFIGSFLSYFYNDFPLLFSLTQSFFFTLGLYLLRFLALKLVGPITPIYDNKTFFKFVFLMFVIMLFSSIPLIWDEMTLFNLGTTLLGQVNGILYLTPFCLIFDPFTPKRFFHAWQKWQGFALAIVLSHLALYLPLPVPILLSLLPLYFGILCLFAYYFKQIPTCVTLLCLSVLYLGKDWQLFQAETFWLFGWISLTAMGSIGLATLKR